MKTVTISGRMSLSPEQNPLRSRAATVLFERRVVGRLGRDRALLARIELVPVQTKWLDSLAVKNVFDGGLDRFENAADSRPWISLEVRAARSLGIDHLADVVVELDQVDEDRPLDLEQEILLVVLELGMQPIDDPLARGLGAAARAQTSPGANRAVGPVDRSVALMASSSKEASTGGWPEGGGALPGPLPRGPR